MARRREFSIDKKRADAIADKIEIRLARAILKAFDKMESDFSVSQAEEIIAAKSVRRAGSVLTQREIENRLKPSAKIIEDAVFAGGKLGAEVINE